MKFEKGYKILVPTNINGPSLAHTHLISHKGLVRMIADLGVTLSKINHPLQKHL
jgi:hypothetical protein